MTIETKKSYLIGLAGFLGAAALLVGGCPVETPANNDATLDVEQFTLATGQTRNASGNFTVRSQTTVNIDGDIVADGARGQTIRIEAEGDIFIGGKITAGAGAIDDSATAKLRQLSQLADNSGNGGDIIITSNNGNIVFMDTAELTAGNGADGNASVNEGAAGRGGDISLNAPNGSITFPQTPQAFRLGDGGTGADLALDANTIDVDEITMNNVGGRSGFPFIDEGVIEGVPSEQITLEEELRDDVRGTLIGNAGDIVTMFAIDPQTGPFAGGAAGDTGAVIVAPGSDSDLAKPNHAWRSQTATFEDFVTSVGTNGEKGWISGSDGSTVDLTGRNGASAGQNGQSVLAVGGNGGDCGAVGTVLKFWTAVGCTPGNGADATAVGGDGATGRNPSGIGGFGGLATAQSGTGGSGIAFLNLSSGRGACGSASATGGRGGDGGQACIPFESVIAGTGGEGGKASAETKSTCNSSQLRLTAVGGNGGNGGDSPVTPGTAGARGDASVTENDDLNILADTLAGNAGRQGQICVQNDNGNSNENSNGNENSNDNSDAPTVREKVLNTTLQSRNIGTEGDCETANFVGILEFNVPANAIKIHVKVTGSNMDSRANVQIEPIGGNSNGQEVIKICGSDQTSNSTEFEHMPQNVGRQWLIAISDRMFVSPSYEVCVEVELAQ